MELDYLLSKDHFKKAAKSTIFEIWGCFMWLGQVLSGLVGVYAFIVMLKLVIAQLMSCKSIHKLHGWLWKIIVGCIPSIAKYLLFHNQTGMIKQLQK